MKICVYCGSFVDENDKFCGSCGKAIIIPGAGEELELPDFPEEGEEAEAEGEPEGAVSGEDAPESQKAGGSKKKIIGVTVAIASVLIILVAAAVGAFLLFGTVLSQDTGFYYDFRDNTVTLRSKTGNTVINGVKDFSYTLCGNGRYALVKVVEDDWDNVLYFYNGLVLRKIKVNFDDALISEDGSRIIITEADESGPVIYSSFFGFAPLVMARDARLSSASPDLSAVVYYKDEGAREYYVNNGREVRFDQEVLAVSPGARRVFYTEGNDLYVTSISNPDDSTFLLNNFGSFGSLKFNKDCSQVLISTGFTTYFSEKGEEAVSLGTLCYSAASYSESSGLFNSARVSYSDLEDFRKALWYSVDFSFSSFFSGKMSYGVYTLGSDNEFNKISNGDIDESLLEISFSEDCRTMVCRRGNDIVRIDCGEKKAKTKVIAEDAGSVKYVSPDCSVIYYVSTEGCLMAVKNGSEPVEIVDRAEDMDSASYFGDSCVFVYNQRVYFSDGGKPVKANVNVSFNSSVSRSDTGCFVLRDGSLVYYSFDGRNWVNVTPAG